MTTAAAPNPQNIIILAALGIGTYWFLTRRAAAAGLPATNSPAAAALYAKNDASLWSAVGSIIGKVLPSQTNAYQAANARNSGPVGGSLGDEQITALTSSSSDGVAWNPVGTAPYEAGSAYSFDGSDGAWWN